LPEEPDAPRLLASVATLAEVDLALAAGGQTVALARAGVAADLAGLAAEAAPVPLAEHAALRFEARGYATAADTDTAIFCRSDNGTGFCRIVASGSTIALVPVFLAALLVVRGLPALVYRGTIGRRDTVAAGLLQATSLPFIVAASMIGMELGLLDQATGAGLIAAGLLSVLLFPLLALTLLRRGEAAPVTVAAAPRLTPTTK